MNSVADVFLLRLDIAMRCKATNMRQSRISRGFFHSCIQNPENIKDRAFCENSSRLLDVNYFCKTLDRSCLTGFKVRLCI